MYKNIKDDCCVFNVSRFQKYINTLLIFELKTKDLGPRGTATKSLEGFLTVQLDQSKQNFTHSSSSGKMIISIFLYHYSGMGLLKLG